MSIGHAPRSSAIRGLRSWVILGVTAIIVFLTLGIWRLFPVYPDEIFYRALVSHAFFESFERTSVWTFCGGSGQTVAVPYVFYPAATIFAGNSFIEDLAYNRLIAAVIMATCFFVLWITLRRLASGSGELRPAANQTWFAIPTIIFCSAVLLCCLGTLPATLAMVRAESGIYVLVASLVLSFANWKQSAPRTIVAAGFILFVFTVSLFQHPKALYFLPAVAVSMYAMLWNRSRLACAAALSCLTWAGAEGYWINKAQFLSCPEIPRYEAYVRSFNIDVTKSLSDPASFVSELFQNNGPERFLKIARKTMFIDGYDANYLPAVKQSTFSEVTNSMIGICWIFLSSVSIGAVVWYLYKITVSLRARARRLHWTNEFVEYVGMLILYAGAISQIAVNKTSWFYDCSYWFWMLIFLAAPSLLRALKIQSTTNVSSIKKLIAGAFLLILFASTLSTVLSAQTFYKAFKSGFGGPGMPIVTMNPSATRLSIERALAQCELTPASPRLIVDDITYPFVQKSHKTISVSYAVSLTSPQEAIVRAKALGSSGMIFGCSNSAAFPSLLFKKDGGICCTKFNQ